MSRWNAALLAVVVFSAALPCQRIRGSGSGGTETGRPAEDEPFGMLPGLGALSGKVVSALDGSPVEGVEIRIRQYAGKYLLPGIPAHLEDHWMTWIARTDADGLFRVLGLIENAEVRIDVLHEDFCSLATITTRAWESIDIGSIAIEPRETGIIEITVQDPEGRPVEGARVFLRAVGIDGPPIQTWAPGGPFHFDLSEGPAQPRSMAATNQTGLATFRNVVPGTYRGYAFAPGRSATASEIIEKKPGLRAAASIEQPEGIDIRATVLMPDGRPAAGARVALTAGRRTKQDFFDSVGFTSRRLSASCTTDDSGRAWLGSYQKEMDLDIGRAQLMVDGRQHISETAIVDRIADDLAHGDLPSMEVPLLLHQSKLEIDIHRGAYVWSLGHPCQTFPLRTIDLHWAEDRVPGAIYCKAVWCKGARTISGMSPVHTVPPGVDSISIHPAWDPGQTAKIVAFSEAIGFFESPALLWDRPRRNRFALHIPSVASSPLVARLVDREGIGVAGAVVTLLLDRDRCPWPPEPNFKNFSTSYVAVMRCRTDQSGDFSFPFTPEIPGILAVLHPEVGAQVLPLPAVSGAPLALARGGSFKGRIDRLEDAGPRPFIALRSKTCPLLLARQLRKDGSFEFHGLGPGSWSLFLEDDSERLDLVSPHHAVALRVEIPVEVECGEAMFLEIPFSRLRPFGLFEPVLSGSFSKKEVFIHCLRMGPSALESHHYGCDHYVLPAIGSPGRHRLIPGEYTVKVVRLADFAILGWSFVRVEAGGRIAPRIDCSQGVVRLELPGGPCADCEVRLVACREESGAFLPLEEVSFKAVPGDDGAWHVEVPYGVYLVQNGRGAGSASWLPFFAIPLEVANASVTWDHGAGG